MCRSDGGPACSRRARFGDLLPLPQVQSVDVNREEMKAVNRSVRQRVMRRAATASRVADAVLSINTLAGFADQSSWPVHCLNQAQKSAMSNISRAVADRAPAPSTEVPEAAFKQLLRRGPGYLAGPGSLASYRRGCVSLPTGQGVACKLESVLSGDERDAVINFEAKMMLSDEEIAGTRQCVEAPGCFFDPVLAGSPQEYAIFVADMVKAGIVEFTCFPKCEVGAFFVSKKSGRLRLILDARRANVLFRKPPSTLLGSME
jgi:hypothetical protein